MAKSRHNAPLRVAIAKKWSTRSGCGKIVFGIFGADISQRKTAAVARKGVAMGKVLLPALLAVLISACAANAVELQSSSDPTDNPFGMGAFAAPEGVTKDKWRKIKADILAELPKLTKCQSNLDECTSTVRKFEEIVKEAERHEGLAKISFINSLINALIDYEPDRNQWGVADQWTAPFVNKKGAFETGHGDCEDYALAKYVALRQAGVRSEDVRVALVHDNAVRADHAILVVRYDKRWLVLDNRWDKLVEDKELTQFKPLAVVDAGGVTVLAKTVHLEWQGRAGGGPKASSDEQHRIVSAAAHSDVQSMRVGSQFVPSLHRTKQIYC